MWNHGKDKKEAQEETDETKNHKQGQHRRDASPRDNTAIMLFKTPYYNHTPEPTEAWLAYHGEAVYLERLGFLPMHTYLITNRQQTNISRVEAVLQDKANHNCGTLTRESTPKTERHSC